MNVLCYILGWKLLGKGIHRLFRTGYGGILRYI